MLNKRYKHKYQNHEHIIEIEPLNISSTWLRGDNKAPAVRLITKYKNFINGMFFDFDTDKLFRTLVVDGRVISQRPAYDNDAHGTLIVYKDGRVEVKTILDILHPANVHVAIQGFNCDYEANGSKNLTESILKEGFLNDVMRLNVRPGIGYNSKKNKIIIVVKNADHNGIRQALRNQGCIDSNGDTLGIGLDSGDSRALVLNGKVLIATSRPQRNIIFFQ